MMILPPLFALYHFYWRFLVIWTAFAVVTAYFLSKPFLEKPMRVTTPRQVYWFFFLCNKVAFAIAVVGYLLILLDVFMGKRFGLGYVATMFMFYGLFYGVIGRDLASLCADKMAASLGYSSSNSGGLPQRDLDLGKVCAICCDTLDSVTEDSITLPTCKHVFHSFCIRGWRIVGKRECPCCKEKVGDSERATFGNFVDLLFLPFFFFFPKVELQDVFVQPWEKQSVLWSYILDMTRYLIVWNPVLFGIGTFAIKILDH
jgi:RING finger protein 121